MNEGHSETFRDLICTFVTSVLTPAVLLPDVSYAHLTLK